MLEEIKQKLIENFEETKKEKEFKYALQEDGFITAMNYCILVVKQIFNEKGSYIPKIDCNECPEHSSVYSKVSSKYLGCENKKKCIIGINQKIDGEIKNV